MYAHLPGSDFDLVTTIFLIIIFTCMKPKEKLVREDDEIKLGPILNCSLKYRWRQVKNFEFKQHSEGVGTP